MIYNQLVAPGLGSMMGGRFIVGSVQLFLALGGCALVVYWLLAYFYRMAFQPLTGPDSAITEGSHGWLATLGLVCFAVSWLWSGITSLSLQREANKEAAAAPGAVPPLIAEPPTKREGSG